MDKDDFEARFAALKQLAAEEGSDLDLCITVGGVRLNEAYRLRRSPDAPETLEGQLDEIEQWVADPRFAAAAKATRLMVQTEALAKDLIGLAKTRAEEYRVAIEAFQSISSTPPLDDSENDLAVQVATIARDPDRFDTLIRIKDMLDKVAKTKEQPQAEADKEDTEQ